MMGRNKDKTFEFIRFCIVGTIAAGIHYAVYYALKTSIDLSLAYTAGYVLSLICNFFLTAYLTFRKVPSFRRALGFGGSHLVNYLLHILLFKYFIFLEISEDIAPILVLLIVVPINFVLLRWVFKNKRS